MNGNIKVYSDLGNIIIEIPGQDPKSFTTQSSLIATNSENKVTVKYGGTNLFYNVAYTQIKKRNGDAWGINGSLVKNALNQLFESDNPSGFATQEQVADLVQRIKRITQEEDDGAGGGGDGDGDSGGGGDVWVISVDGESDSGVVKVRENSGLMSVGQSEVFVDGGKVKFSVRSNTGNLGSEAKSEAIVITGEESSVNSIVDMKGTMKLSRSTESKFVMDASATTNGQTNFTGDQSYLNLPNGSSLSDNLMIGKSVVIGDIEDTLSRGERNTFEVKGLSTGDVVKVDVEVRVSSNGNHTLEIANNRDNETSSVFTNTAGSLTVPISITTTVDNYSSLIYYLNLDTDSTGVYHVRKITVTIS